MKWELHANDATAASAARHAFMIFLHASCNSTSDFDSAEIIFGELVANVIRYAPGPIAIRATCNSQGSVILHVWDSGPGFELNAMLPCPESESGRGIYMVSKLCPYISTHRVWDGHEVSVVLPVTAIARNGDAKTRYSSVDYL